MIENVLASKEAEIRIYDSIGRSLNGLSGESVAGQIDVLNASGTEQITLRISSMGGSWYETMMIIAAMQRSKAHITAVIDGLAASAAGLIAIAADYTLMSDGGLFMVHGANTIAGDGDEEVLSKYNEAIMTLFAKRLNKTAAETQEFFNKGDLYLTASEALELGLINEVIETPARDVVTQAKQVLEASNYSMIEVFNLYKTKMNEEITATEVANTETVEVVSAAEVVNLKADLTAKTDEVVNLAAEVVNLKNDLKAKAEEIVNLTSKVKAFEQKEAEAKAKEILDVVNAAVEARKISASAKDAFIKHGEMNINSLKEVLNAIPAPIKLSSIIQGDSEETFKFKSIDEQIAEARTKKSKN